MRGNGAQSWAGLRRGRFVREPPECRLALPPVALDIAALFAAVPLTINAPQGLATVVCVGRDRVDAVLTGGDDEHGLDVTAALCYRELVPAGMQR